MKPSAPEQHLGLRVPVDLLRRFAQVAAAEERSTSAELRRLMRQRVAAAEAAHAERVEAERGDYH